MTFFSSGLITSFASVLEREQVDAIARTLRVSRDELIITRFSQIAITDPATHLPLAAVFTISLHTRLG